LGGGLAGSKEETYRNLCFELVPIAPGSLLDRVDAIKRSARSDESAPTLFKKFAVRPDGAYHQWRKDPSRELSIALVADERFGRATG
jgi:hypothetical protein